MLAVRPKRFVEQTDVGFPTGNCVQASYASLLDVPLQTVPRFDPGHLDGANQLEEERRWLRTRGYEMVVVPASAKTKLDVAPDIYHLISGLSPRGFGHRCVARGGELIWDPHPSHAGLVDVWSYAFLVPIDPAATLATAASTRSTSRLPGRPLLGFMTAFESAYGDPETLRPYLAVSPPTTSATFCCPYCRCPCPEITSAQTRSLFQDRQHGFFWCPRSACRQRFVISWETTSALTPSMVKTTKATESTRRIPGCRFGLLGGRRTR